MSDDHEAPRRAALSDEDDATVAVPRRAALPDEDDATRVAPASRRTSDSRSGSRSASATHGTPAPRASVAGPVPEPAFEELARLRSSAIPRAYGARAVPAPSVELPDAGARSLGSDPAARSARDHGARAELPSILKRDARARRFTLISYAAVIVVSVTGLWVIARIVWG